MADLFLYDSIDKGSAKTFIDQLNAAKGAVTVRINSGGGSVFEGLAIFNAIKRHGKVTVKIDGLAASIASLIAVGGDRVEMANNALLMIHNPWLYADGDSAALRKQADILDQVKSSMLQAYCGKSGKTTDEIAAIMDAETWYTADEAKNQKLIDAIYNPPQANAQYIGIEKFTNLPDRIKNMTQSANQSPTTSTTVSPEIQARLDELDAIKAEIYRKDEIRAKFTPWAKIPGITDLMNSLVNNRSVTAEDATAKLLAKLGEGMEPTAAHFPHRIDPYTGQAEDAYNSIQFGANAHHNDFIAAATDAILIKNGLRPKYAHPAARDLQGMSIVEMARTMLSQSGGTVRRSLFGFKGEKSTDVIKAALTSSDFPQLLENVAGKSLMSGYDNEPASHKLWTKESLVPDFKLQKRVAVSEAPNLELVKESGEYKYGNMNEKGMGFFMETYGKILELSRQAIINDDLNAFTTIPNGLGRSASRLESDKVYAILTGNPLMSDAKELFHEDHKNLITSAGALSVASLGHARAKLRRQRGMQDAILNVVPKFLILPATLESLAEQLIFSKIDPSKQNDTLQNAWINSLQIVVDARLDESSESTWYSAADYNQVDTIEVAYLTDQRGAFMEQEQNFDTDGLKIKCRLDFAGMAVDWIGLIKVMA
ncbi:MAG: ClpP-like prohead protease/major capsid protein fusion protein [Methylococcales bacterium]